MNKSGLIGLLYGIGIFLMGFIPSGTVSGKGIDPEVVELPPFYVWAIEVDFSGWTRLQSPNFIVYTDAPLKQVRPIMRQMEMMHLLVQDTFGRRPLNKSRAIIVLPAEQSVWNQLRSKGVVEWRTAVSHFKWIQPGCVVQYDWKNKGIHYLWASMFHLELNWLGIEMPLALSKGFSSYFETAQLTHEGLRIGEQNDRILTAKDPKNWFGWDELFKIDTRSPEYVKDSDSFRDFMGQSALFVHFLMVTEGENGAIEKLLKWAALMRANHPPTENRFIEVFGMSWEECNRCLKQFVRRKNDFGKLHHFSSENLDISITEKNVKKQEMQDLFVLVQIITQKIPESEMALDILLSYGLPTPKLRPLLVSGCRFWDRNKAVMEQLKILIREGNPPPEVFDLGTRLLGEKYLTQPGLTTLSQKEYDELRLWAHRALQMEPLLGRVVEILALTEAFAPEVDSDTLGTIKELALRLEGNGYTDDVLMAFALVAYRVEAWERSRGVCERLINSEYTKQDIRIMADKLLRNIEGILNESKR